MTELGRHGKGYRNYPICDDKPQARSGRLFACHFLGFDGSWRGHLCEISLFSATPSVPSKSENL